MKKAGLLFVAVLVMAGMARAASGELGTNLAGENCRLAAAAGDATDILCGASSARAGALHTAPLNGALPGEGGARREAIAAAARQMPDAGLAGGALDCDKGKSAGAEAVLFICHVTANGWPHLILAAAGSGRIFVADGLPGLLPVLEAAITVRGGPAFSAAESGAALETVKAAFPARMLEAGTGDHADYQRFTLLAHQAIDADDYAGAEAAWRGALDIETRLFGPDSAAVGGTLMELALQVSNQQRFDESAALLRRADPIIQSASGGAAMRARLASYRAMDAANQRKYADALRFARAAVTARQADVDAVKAGSADLNGNAPIVPAAMEGELAHALWVEAQMALRLGDLPGAQSAGEQALYIVSAQPGLPLSWRPQMVSLMGDINARQGRIVAAERDYTDALTMDRKLFGESAPTILAQLQLARFYSEQQVYASALAQYREAFAALAKDKVARAQILPDEIAPFLAAASAPGSEADRSRLDAEMFLASQLPDSGVAGQTIARVAARRAAATPALAAAVREAEDAERALADLRLRLADERARPDEERDAAREKALSEAVSAASAKSDAAAARLRADFPAYAKLADPAAVTLAALQSHLKPRQAFVSFVIGLHAGYVLLATHDSFTVRPVSATTDSLAADVADLRSAFVPRLGRLPDFSLGAAFALYRQLLGPVAPQLAGVDHLVVASSGDLASLPFSLLVTEDSAGHDYGHAAWLIRKMAVAQIPSAGAFLALATAPHEDTPRGFLGLGNPAFDGAAGNARALGALASTCQQGGSVDPALLRSLPPLPDTAAEVEAVGHDLGAAPQDILLGPAASETALRAKPLDQYAVLYFATHGVLPGELHCQAQPGLALSPPPQPAAPDADGFLTAGEIAGLRLNARLVVLSACNTAAGGGSHFGGGALEGLADAFFDAGAHGVLASHWEVPSGATTRLMTHLFADLAHDSGMDTAEALRRAQLGLIAEGGTAHPFDWAAFTLIGDGS